MDIVQLESLKMNFGNAIALCVVESLLCFPLRWEKKKLHQFFPTVKS